MIATWMVYCLLSALGLSVAAALAERALLGGRGSVRLVWIGAVALSLLVPAMAFRFSQQQVVVQPSAVVSTTASPVQGAPAGSDVGSNQAFNQTLPGAPPVTNPATPAASQTRNWRATLNRLDEPLGVAWLTLSLALAFNFVGGIVTLAWMRRRWEPRTVMGVEVFVSDRTGPAVVGVAAPAIVIPEWVLALEPSQLALLLRHEQEHQRAGDGRLLTAAELALIAMPWNLALWWQVLRLRVAVELDCDARVLQVADERSYGDLLLEVARPRSGPRLMGATAFAERATQLERRIQVLARHRSRTTRTARALATLIGLVALTVAWVAPHPPAPARPAPTPIIPTPVQTPADQITPRVSGRSAGNVETSSAAAAMTTVVQTTTPTQMPATDPPPRQLAPISLVMNGRVSAPVEQPRIMTAPCVRARADLPVLVDSIFDRLFEGIALTNNQAAGACALLARLHQEQLTADEIANVTLLTNQTQALAARVQRDTELRALLSNETDRATFDARIAQPTAGARGGGRGARGGGAAGDTAAGGGGRARGGGGGAAVAFDSLARRYQLVLIDSGRIVQRGQQGQQRGGGGGGGAVTQSQGQQAGGGARGAARGGGGGGGRGGAPLDSAAMAMMIVQANDATYRRLFDGIQLTADQEASARAIITRSQPQLGAQRPRPQTILRLNRGTGMITMQSDKASELIALVPSEADRAILQSRIVINQP